MSAERSSGEMACQPTSAELFSTFLYIGLLSFGGPAAQISLMHRVLVDEKKWLGERDYLAALGFCMLLPGPEAMQLATYAGWRLKGVAGGLMAGLLFVMPGAMVILALSAFYAVFGNLPLVNALFLGIKAAVLVVVLEALIRVSRRALSGPQHYAIAAIAFVALFFFNLPFPAIIVAAGLFGCFGASGSSEPAKISGPAASLTRTAGTIALWLVLWWAPLFAIDLAGAPAPLSDIGTFFSKLAVVTFGGAYAVLAYMAQQVVGEFGWLSAGEMVDGLGLAETTPGPLILVTEFVGFLATYRAGGFWLGLAGAAVTLWATFTPCFLWIFAGAPYINRIAGNPKLSSALSAITAAVVGVILNLSIWFALHVLFAVVTETRTGVLTLWLPDFATLDWRAVALALASGFMLLQLRWATPLVLAISALSGWLLSLI